MPRVHHRKAAKDYPDIGVQKGEKYYTWRIKLAWGGKTCRSKTYPRPSQLNLGFRGRIGDIEMDLGNANSLEDLTAVAEAMRELGEEQQEKFDNMPEPLQYGDTGQTLEEQAQGLEEWADHIDELVDSFEDPENEDEDEDWDQEEAWQEAFGELKSDCEGGNPGL